MSERATKSGRPRKAPPAPANVADVSLEMLERYKQAIAATLGKPKYKPVFSHLSADQEAALLGALAHELAAYPAMAGLMSQLQLNRRGPKPRHDHGAFAATVRDLLERYGIALKQWDNGRENCNELTDFCRELTLAAGITSIKIRGRTARKLPQSGFTGNSSDH